MGIEARIVANFQLRSTTPREIRWEGVLEWVDPDHPNASGNGTRLLKVQCGLREGTNGPFLSMPYVRRFNPATGKQEAVRGTNGKYRNYVDIGDIFQRSGTACVLAYLASNPQQPVAPAPSGVMNATPPQEMPPFVTQAEGDALMAAQRAFPGATLGPVTSEPDDPFGDLPW